MRKGGTGVGKRCVLILKSYCICKKLDLNKTRDSVYKDMCAIKETYTHFKVVQEYGTCSAIGTISAQPLISET